MPRGRAIVRAAIALSLLVASATAAAQEVPPPKASVRLELDNDLLAPRGSGPPADYDYTHGTTISFHRPVATAAHQPRRLLALVLGHEIYTPRRDSPDPIAGERPYAALLYGAVQLQRLTRTTLQAVEARAGVTGPPALGEVVQNGVHRLLHNRLEAGWASQLPSRLALSVDYDAFRVLGPVAPGRPSRFVAAKAGATLGTLRRAVRAGADAYYGFGAACVASADAPLVAYPGRFHVIMGYQQSQVLHDAFIEGVGATDGAVRIPWVAEAYVGAGGRIGRVSLEYRYVLRSREYRTQPAGHAYGSVALSVHER